MSQNYWQRIVTWNIKVYSQYRFIRTYKRPLLTFLNICFQAYTNCLGDDIAVPLLCFQFWEVICPTREFCYRSHLIEALLIIKKKIIKALILKCKWVDSTTSKFHSSRHPIYSDFCSEFMLLIVFHQFIGSTGQIGRASRRGAGCALRVAVAAVRTAARTAASSSGPSRPRRPCRPSMMAGSRLQPQPSWPRRTAGWWPPSPGCRRRWRSRTSSWSSSNGSCGGCRSGRSRPWPQWPSR